MKKRKILVAYIPVFHEGYRKLIERSEVQEVYLLDPSVSHVMKGIARDMRAVNPTLLSAMLNQARTMISPFFELASVAKEIDLRALARSNARLDNVEIILPEEDISDYLVKEFFGSVPVSFDSAFLRWDSVKVFSKLPPDEDICVTESEIMRKFLLEAEGLTKRSSDWWRQVGAITVMEDGKRLVAFNEHVPAQEQYMSGDPRSNFDAGEMIECSTALHGERAIIATVASRKGMSLSGADLYVTMFPCVDCARQIGVAGVRNVFFREGYANLNGREVLRQKNICVTRVIF